MTYDWTPGGFGLYLHWPYCKSKCPYCDFNSHVTDKIDVDRWASAYRSEIERHAMLTGDRVLQTVYFGGGTPSLMEAELVSDILSTIRQNWRVVNDLEVTIEANPSSVEATRFAAFRSAGVNRVSLGVQALNDDALRALGRLHTKRDAHKALEIARNTFERVSFDLIYARQYQTLIDWEQELKEALTLAGDHLSLYQLTIEEGTAFHDRAMRGKLLGLPDETCSADMFDLTQELTTAAGLPAYEVSNHAKPGSESRHNMIYWRGGDYIGVGPGAHGRITMGSARLATETHRDPNLWLRRVSEVGNGDSLVQDLSDEERALEYLLMSLRTHEGTSLARIESMSGVALSQAKLAELSDLGLIETSKGFVRTTAKGRPILNAILRELAP